MKTISAISSLFLVAILLTATVSFGQSKADPGISTSNYKHPHKARIAKKQNPDQNAIQVVSANTVEKQAAYKGVPKYANRPASLVVTSPGVEQEAQINPLVASRNYKTNNKMVRNAGDEVAGRPDSNPDSTTID